MAQKLNGTFQKNAIHLEFHKITAAWRFLSQRG